MYSSIQIHSPVFFSEIGQKQNNEDYLIPNDQSPDREKKVFICCDGVGGAPSGEIASQIACLSMAEYFKQHTISIHNMDFFQNAIDYAREKMRTYEREQPESKGMKTTMTALSFHQGGATLAWMGDSRIYQVRNGKILYQTWDHSYVNTLVKKGLLTEEETRNHPKSNIITRTLGVAKSDRKPEVKMIGDIQKDDFFLLCTDGLLENVTDKLIEKWLTKNESPEKIKSIMLNYCKGKTHDNFSMVLLKIKSIHSHANG